MVVQIRPDGDRFTKLETGSWENPKLLFEISRMKKLALFPGSIA